MFLACLLSFVIEIVFSMLFVAAVDKDYIMISTRDALNTSCWKGSLPFIDKGQVPGSFAVYGHLQVKRIQVIDENQDSPCGHV